MAWKKWYSYPCLKGSSDLPGLPSRREITTFGGPVHDFRKAQYKQTTTERLHRTSNARNFASMQRVVAGNTASSVTALNATGAGTCPVWVADIPDSHSIRFCGGVVFCDKCGSLAASKHGNSKLFTNCSGVIKSGSRGRLNKVQLGINPIPGAATWPDGRCAKLTLSVKRWKQEPPLEEVSQPLPAQVNNPDSDSGSQQSVTMVRRSHMPEPIDGDLLSFVVELMDAMLREFVRREDDCIEDSEAFLTLKKCAAEHRLGHRPQAWANAMQSFMGDAFDDQWRDVLLERAHPFELAIYELTVEIESM